MARFWTGMIFIVIGIGFWLLAAWDFLEIPQRIFSAVIGMLFMLVGVLLSGDGADSHDKNKAAK